MSAIVQVGRPRDARSLGGNAAARIGRPDAESRACCEGMRCYFFFLRPAAKVFAALVSFFSRVRLFCSAFPAALSCFFVGFFCGIVARLLGWVLS